MRLACEASSEPRVPMTGFALSTAFVLCTFKFALRLSMSLQIGHRLNLIGRSRMLLACRVRLLLEHRHQLVTPVHQLLAWTAVVLGPNGILTEERKGNRRIAIGDHRVGQHAWIHLAPADRLGR